MKTFLFNKNNHFNAANNITFLNILFGLTAFYYINEANYFMAVSLLWLSGLMDIMDGKVARKYNLSNEFGIQLDSFADFLSFVLVPVYLVWNSLFVNGEYVLLYIPILFIYIIFGLIRLISFNIGSEVSEKEKYFTGVPTPLGAILLWLILLFDTYVYSNNILNIIVVLSIAIGFNNKLIKVKHL
jgi:CDP-diacylglycerol--serine O-phosphatidyltransferase